MLTRTLVLSSGGIAALPRVRAMNPAQGLEAALAVQGRHPPELAKVIVLATLVEDDPGHAAAAMSLKSAGAGRGVAR
jgi:hypothetical protein